MKNRLYVITGSPSSGKTKTIETLKQRGFTTTEETARTYIQSQLKKGLTIKQIRANPQKLQDTFAKIQSKVEESLKDQDLVFLDRALPDILSYYKYRKLIIPKFVLQELKKKKYDYVFYLERLPIRVDDVRKESEPEAAEIANFIYQTYTDLGFTIMKVPVMNSEHRVDYILKHIDPKLIK